MSLEASPQGGSIFTDHRFLRSTDGRIWTQTQADYDSWASYARAWGHVRVVARVQDVEKAPSGHLRADGPNVSFSALPTFVGGTGLAFALPGLLRRVAQETAESRTFLLRGPGIVSMAAAPFLMARRRAFGVEVLGDNREVLRHGQVGGGLARHAAPVLGLLEETVCRQARSAAYVTDHSLQSRYPTRTGLQFSITDVDLPPEAFSSSPRDHGRSSRPRHLVMVGSLEQPYKGVDSALRAMRDLEGAQRVDLTVVGDGRLRPTYERLANELRIASRVSFLGSLPRGEAVRRVLSNADVFIMPSRTEGMPRALLEAMAQGLPCLGSAVGDIPHLIGERNTFPRDDYSALASLIVSLDSAQMNEMSRSNWNRAREIASRDLGARRQSFLNSIGAASEPKWTR